MMMYSHKAKGASVLLISPELEQNRLHQVTDALIAILSDEMPDIIWKEAVVGAIFPKELTGYVICDRMAFENISKLDYKVKATYLIQIICPDTKAEVRRIEDLALQVRKILTKNYTLDNWAQNGMITDIIFGTATGNSKIGTAIINYEVAFEMED